MLKSIPYNPDGSIDYSKVDIHNDFGLFPAIFSSPIDIEQFICRREVNVPTLSALLTLRRKGKLEFTPTELKFYFDQMFNYIYDVYRIPIEQTYVDTEKWLDYINLSLVHGGFDYFISNIYSCGLWSHFLMGQRLNAHLKKYGKDSQPELINYHTDISEKSSYYVSERSTIEQFWIKTGQFGEPVGVDNEYYMRVWVFADHVYIFGCDDCSYMFKGESEEKNKEFALFLKVAVPVWNFKYFKSFHSKLEFSN